MALETEATNSITDTKKDLNQNELTMKKLKRILEVSSVICSTASINMVIACLYGIAPDILGFKSQEMIFDLAFSLLVASAALVILAMATSKVQDRKLQFSFPTPRISTLFSSLLTVFLSFKNKGCEKFSEPANTQPLWNHTECIKNLKEKRGSQEYSNSLDNFSIKNSEDAEYSLQNARKSTAFSPSSDKSSEIKSPPQLQKFRTPFLFGQCSVTQSPIHFTKSWKFIQFDLGQMEKKSQLVPLLQQTFITNGNFNEVKTRSVSDKHPQVGIVSPIKINNSNDVKNCDLYKNLSPSVESIHSCQKLPKKRLNTNTLVEQQSFYQNAGRTSNESFKDNNIQSESNAPIKSFHTFPSSQREVFSNRLYTTDLQNLHKVQNQFPNVRCHDSREIPYTELLQTVPLSSGEFSYKRSGTGKFNLHKMKEVDTRDHCSKSNQKVTPNLKNVRHPLRKLKESSQSQRGIINTHYGWNTSSIEWGENFAERPDIPMEICDKAPNDQVLEVSLKLNDLNFMF